ncbi:riboflavin synthase [Nitrosomonas sp. JL21]|uniref:riboflavin synthase n=1 Tax=Nitrosomonas sp. JL21 TaxID=153949 RepID=UPI001367AE63|nr:riboflavin synthase [Nitrosomonas sp. JL21]MBL8496667.1 riboflavin synthase [Nitrosomonas sp.]MXS76419.1 riboflavin synthase [Nitrosomonas sp. JL21]
MFTGIIQAMGEIKHTHPIAEPSNHGLTIHISAGVLDLSDVKPGDSVAVDGVCLTVTGLRDDVFTVDVSEETLHCTHGLDQVGKRVNLEKAMRLSDRLGGHLVSGHVDALGTVAAYEPVGESVDLVVKAPSSILDFLVHKGSITVNGVSLTVNRIDGDEFSINLIPHTLAMTTLSELGPGMTVNLETDMLARYVAKLLPLQR